MKSSEIISSSEAISMFDQWKRVIKEKDTNPLYATLFVIPLFAVFHAIEDKNDLELLEIGIDSMLDFLEEQLEHNMTVCRHHNHFDMKSRVQIELSRSSISLFPHKVKKMTKAEENILRQLNILPFTPPKEMLNISFGDNFIIIFPTAYWDNVIRNMKNFDDIPRNISFSKNYLKIRCLDALTYPKPCNTLKFLLPINTTYSLLVDIVVAQLGLKDSSDVQLYFRGKILLPENKELKLLDIGLYQNCLIILSQRPQKVRPLNSAERSFALSLCVSSNKVLNRHDEYSGNILKYLLYNQSLSLFVDIIEKIIKQRFSFTIQREQNAKKSELQLLALLDEEDKEKQKKEKKKMKVKVKTLKSFELSNAAMIDDSPIEESDTLESTYDMKDIATNNYLVLLNEDSMSNDNKFNTTSVVEDNVMINEKDNTTFDRSRKKTSNHCITASHFTPPKPVKKKKSSSTTNSSRLSTPSWKPTNNHLSTTSENVDIKTSFDIDVNNVSAVVTPSESLESPLPFLNISRSLMKPGTVSLVTPNTSDDCNHYDDHDELTEDSNNEKWLNETLNSVMFQRDDNQQILKEFSKIEQPNDLDLDLQLTRQMQLLLDES